MSDTSDPARIERDLDRTRSRLDTHLSELQNRLSPGQVLDDLMGYFRGSEGAEIGRNLLDNVRGNPLPAALTGIGLAWLMASNPRGQAAGDSGTSRLPGASSRVHVYGQDDWHATAARVRDAEAASPRQSDESDQTYSARLDEVRGQAIGLARHAQESTESFGQRVRDAMSSVQDAVTGSAQGIRDSAGSAASAVGHAASSAGASAQDMARDAMRSVSGALSQGGKSGGNLATALTESPVLLGALGLAAGALLGALLPQTEGEEEALGGIAGQVRQTATSLAQQGMDRGKEVAQSVMDKGRDSAEAHGLTGGRSAGELVDAALSGKLADDAKAVAQEVLEHGHDAVRSAVAPEGSQPA